VKIFGPRRKEDESWGKLHNDELHSLYSSPNIVRLIKSRCARHVARMGREKMFTGFRLGDHWEGLGVSGRINYDGP
jgi:hypothetical protein